MIGRPLQSAAHPRGGRRWIRVLWPSFLIVIWVIGAALGGPYFGRIDEVSSNEQANYLPASAEATKVQQLRGEFSESNAIPAIVVFTSEQVLSEAQLEEIAAQITGLPAVAGVAEEVSPAIPSDDGRAVQVFVPIEPDAEIGNVVAELSRGLQDRVPEGVQVHVTGPAGFTADLLEAFTGIDGLLLGVALGAVFLILIAVYRSALLPLVVLSTSLFALCVALLCVWWLAKAGVSS